MKDLWKIIPLLATLLVTACGQQQGGEPETQFMVQGIGFQEEDGGQWGIMDMEGNVVIEPRFSDITTPVVNGVFTSVGSESCTLYAIDGHEARKIGTYKSAGSFATGLCPVIDMDLQAKYIDKEGKTVIDLSMADGVRVVRADNFSCGRALVERQDGTHGYIDEQGNTVVPFSYVNAYSYAEDVALVWLQSPRGNKSAQWAVIDRQGEVLYTKQFKEFIPMDYMYQEGFLVVSGSDEERYYLLDREGKVAHRFGKGVLPYSLPVNGMLMAYDRSTQKNGLTDTEGHWVLEPQFSTVCYNGRLLAASTDDEVYTLYSLQGEELEQLPKGYPAIFGQEFRNYDDFILVHRYKKGYTLTDGSGQRLEDKTRCYDSNSSYSEMAYIVDNDSSEEGEEYEDGDGWGW